MDFSLAVLVSVDKRERFEVLLPSVSTASFRGESLARLLDDRRANWLADFESLAPFAKGNRRVAAILYNWFAGSMDWPTSIEIAAGFSLAPHRRISTGAFGIQPHRTLIPTSRKSGR